MGRGGAAASRRCRAQQPPSTAGGEQRRSHPSPVALVGKGGGAGQGRAGPGGDGRGGAIGGGVEPPSARPHPEGTWPRRRRRYLGQSRRDSQSPPGSRSGAPRRAGTGGRAARPAPAAALTARLRESLGPGRAGAGAVGPRERSRERSLRQTRWLRWHLRGRPFCRRPSVPPRWAVREGKGSFGAEAQEGFGTCRQPPAERERSPTGPALPRPAGSSRPATGRLLAPLAMSTAAAVRALHVYS